MLWNKPKPQPQPQPRRLPVNAAVSDSPNRLGQDRTQEFVSICKFLCSLQNGVQANMSTQNPLRQRSDFTVMAKKIGKDCSRTFTKLEKLRMLAKKMSLFNDRTVEIEELTCIIRQDVGRLNEQIAQLQKLVQSQSSQKSKQCQSHSNTVVISLQSKLASMSNDFKSVLEVRTENLKQQRSRREQYSKASVPTATLQARNFDGFLLMQDEPRKPADVSIEMDSHASQQLQLINEQESYIRSRADTMQNIECTIVELGSIFQQLAHMVKEQEETVQRIDANVEETQLNVEAAHFEILKYFKSVSSKRWLVIKIFLILIFFFFIFVVFFN